MSFRPRGKLTRTGNPTSCRCVLLGGKSDVAIGLHLGADIHHLALANATIQRSRSNFDLHPNSRLENQGLPDISEDRSDFKAVRVTIGSPARMASPER